MKKLLTIGGVLLILSFLALTANAKSHPVKSTSPFTNDLSDRLAADKDFQEFSYSIYQLVGKLQATKTGIIFQKYFQHSISDVELSTLLSSLNFSSKDEFTMFIRKTILLKSEIVCKFPELANSNNKLFVESAAKKTSANFVKPIHTTGDCWVLFLSALSACTQGCAIYYPSDWEACIDWCYGSVIAGSGLCFLLAD